ncbi:hypothetical protein D9M73_209040 [compost metagenome]
MEVPLRVFLIQRGAVDHDHAAGGHALFPGLGGIAGIGIGDVHGQVELVAGLAPVDPVEAFRSALVAFAQLGTGWNLAKGNAVRLEDVATIHQQQLAFRFHYQDLVDGLATQRRRSTCLGESGKAHEKYD